MCVLWTGLGHSVGTSRLPWPLLCFLLPGSDWEELGRLAAAGVFPGPLRLSRGYVGSFLVTDWEVGSECGVNGEH